jgi:hypothetical protein
MTVARTGGSVGARRAAFWAVKVKAIVGRPLGVTGNSREAAQAAQVSGNSMAAAWAYQVIGNSREAAWADQVSVNRREATLESQVSGNSRAATWAAQAVAIVWRPLGRLR